MEPEAVRRQLVEVTSREVVGEEREARGAAWLDANRVAIAEHTAWLDEHGMPLKPEGWFAAMDRCAAGPFMAEGREQPAMPESTVDLD